jgi:hypothetical protein
MDAREFRKKALKLRSNAIADPRPANSASYEAMANVYDALARAADHVDRVRRQRQTAGGAGAPPSS